MLPILTTWDTDHFVYGPELKQSVDMLLGMPRTLRPEAMSGLGRLATVVLHEWVGHAE